MSELFGTPELRKLSGGHFVYTVRDGNVSITALYSVFLPLTAERKAGRCCQWDRSTRMGPHHLPSWGVEHPWDENRASPRHLQRS